MDFQLAAFNILTNVMFYVRFAIIYVLSGFLSVFGLGSFISIFYISLCVIITAIVIYSTIKKDYKLKYQGFIREQGYKIKNNEIRIDHKLYLYFDIFMQYIFDVSMMFCLTRQVVMILVSHPLHFLSIWQPWILLFIIPLSFLLIEWRYSYGYNTYQRMYTIQDNLSSCRRNNKSEPSYSLKFEWKKILIPLFIAILTYATVQLYLCYSFTFSNMLHPFIYSLISFVSSFALSVGYMYFGNSEYYHRFLWAVFMGTSAVLGMVFFSKLIAQAFFDKTAYEFYTMSAIKLVFTICGLSGFCYAITKYNAANYEVETNKMIMSHVEVNRDSTPDSTGTLIPRT